MLSGGVSAEEARAKSTAWAMTYADLSTLLLTFFIMLLVIINDAEKHIDRVINILLDETYEELSQQLDELMLFCHDCSERGISAATWPQDPKPGGQIATLSGGTECAIIRVDTGKKISNHFKISKHFRSFP